MEVYCHQGQVFVVVVAISQLLNFTATNGDFCYSLRQTAIFNTFFDKSRFLIFIMTNCDFTFPMSIVCIKRLDDIIDLFCNVIYFDIIIINSMSLKTNLHYLYKYLTEMEDKNTPMRGVMTFM